LVTKGKGKRNINEKKKREELRQKPYLKFKKTNIRIRFPDRYELQGTFDRNENIQQLGVFVSENLAFPDRPFYFYTTPPKIVLSENESFLSLRLVPAAIVYFSWKDTTNSPPPYLKPSLLSSVLPTSHMLASTFGQLSTNEEPSAVKSQTFTQILQNQINQNQELVEEDKGKEESEEKSTEPKEEKKNALLNKLFQKK